MALPYTDMELIRELNRRGRLRVFGKTTVFFNEIMEDDRYMESMGRDLVRDLATGLDNALCIKYRDRVMKRDHFDRPRTTARYASVRVVVPEGVDVDEAMQRMRGAEGANKGDLRSDQTVGERPDTTGTSDITDAERESSNTDSPE